MKKITRIYYDCFSRKEIDGDLREYVSGFCARHNLKECNNRGGCRKLRITIEEVENERR